MWNGRKGREWKGTEGNGREWKEFGFDPSTMSDFGGIKLVDDDYGHEVTDLLGDRLKADSSYLI